MKLPSFGKPKVDDSVAQAERVARLDAEVVSLRAEVQDLRELLGHLDSERNLLLMASEQLKPGMSAQALAETMHALVFRPFDLASFYVAQVDLEKDLLTFPLYHEGGKARHLGPYVLSERPGLTAKALLAKKPLYTRTLEEAQTQGAIFTPAEKGSGLIPSSWYGVPLGDLDRPLGLVSYQSFQPDAFSEDRRRTMNALAVLLGAALQGYR
ncbi:MAG: hypothetical protein Q8O00_05140 [Holophaga sp.]|nr:hypothetical protein [Holophaga sp.]